MSVYEEKKYFILFDGYMKYYVFLNLTWAKTQRNPNVEKMRNLGYLNHTKLMHRDPMTSQPNDRVANMSSLVSDLHH